MVHPETAFSLARCPLSLWKGNRGQRSLCCHHAMVRLMYELLHKDRFKDWFTQYQDNVTEWVMGHAAGSRHCLSVREHYKISPGMIDVINQYPCLYYLRLC